MGVTSVPGRATKKAPHTHINMGVKTCTPYHLPHQPAILAWHLEREQPTPQNPRADTPGLGVQAHDHKWVGYTSRPGVSQIMAGDSSSVGSRVSPQVPTL